MNRVSEQLLILRPKWYLLFSLIFYFPFTILSVLFSSAVLTVIFGLKCHLFRTSITTQSSPALCDLMDSSLLGSSIHGILQARILEWVAVPSSRESS